MNSLVDYLFFFVVVGDLTREDDVLEWLVQHKSTGDEDDIIEDVTLKTLSTLIQSVDHLAVLFCKYLLEINELSFYDIAKYIF